MNDPVEAACTEAMSGSSGSAMHGNDVAQNNVFFFKAGFPPPTAFIKGKSFREPSAALRPKASSMSSVMHAVSGTVQACKSDLLG